MVGPPGIRGRGYGLREGRLGYLASAAGCSPEVIRTIDADIVALQEVIGAGPTSKGHAEELGALLGMGSTYRCLGEYQKAKEIFQRALELFPERNEYKVFLAMAYYNLGEYAKGMELLLNSLAETSKDEGVIRYQRAIRFYADKLDETW